MKVETTVSQGAIWGTVGFIIVLIIALVVIFGSWLAYQEDDDKFWIGSAVFGVLVGIFASVIYITSMWPFSWEYHEWRAVSGTVDQVSSRTMSDDNGNMVQRFVVRYGNGDERACDDTRCSLLKPGDQLSLTCKREWQWVGEHGWSCNYVSSKRG